MLSSQAVISKNPRRSIWSSLVAVVLSLMLVAQPTMAHNEIVHQQMVDFAYQEMLVVQEQMKTPRSGSNLLSKPEGVDQREWEAFLAKIVLAPGKYRARSSELAKLRTPVTTCSQEIYGKKDLPDRWWDKKLGEISYPVSFDFTSIGNCGVSFNWKPGGIFDRPDKLDHTGTVLGFWTAAVDRQLDDTHLWHRPTNTALLSAGNKFVNDMAGHGLGAILLPLICGLDCLFGDCNDCDKDVKDIANAVNPLEDVAGWLPGLPGLDISGHDWVGMWHHINVTPRASNEFDDRQGEFFEEAGPEESPDPIDVVLMAAFDIVGLTVNYDKSAGTRYQISNADDGHPNTRFRNLSQWQYTTIAHVPFEPVDNLAFYGWRSFRDNADHPISSLGLPLHALGDATVPMHITATSAWGHRPFEDAQERIWPQIRMMSAPPGEQEQLLRRVLLLGFEWWRFILQWRAAHPGREVDTPVRELVTELAKRTYRYSMTMYQQTGRRWPFDRAASTFYESGKIGIDKKEDSIKRYEKFENAANLVRPLIEDGMGATLALLVSAAEILPPAPPEGPRSGEPR